MPTQMSQGGDSVPTPMSHDGKFFDPAVNAFLCWTFLGANVPPPPPPEAGPRGAVTGRGLLL